MLCKRKYLLLTYFHSHFLLMAEDSRKTTSGLNTLRAFCGPNSRCMCDALSDNPCLHCFIQTKQKDVENRPTKKRETTKAHPTNASKRQKTETDVLDEKRQDFASRLSVKACTPAKIREATKLMTQDEARQWSQRQERAIVKEFRQFVFDQKWDKFVVRS